MQSIKRILKEVLEAIRPDKKELSYLRKEASSFISLLKQEIKRKKINASVFVGGSFAKGTLLKKDKYDIDIFIRFDKSIENPSSLLEEIVEGIRKVDLPVKKVHGSRDYFQIEKGKLILELIPVYKIKKPKEARNVTDLSYFHVNYVKKRLNRLKDNVLLAKQFCYACNIYGAESYIKGFSGYGLECLIINYKSFLKMLKALAKLKEKIALDPEKHYKKGQIFFSINEGKLQSPIILVDPTWKERNVLAALSQESFAKFQEHAKAFLKAPSRRFFEEHKFDEGEFKKSAQKKQAEFIHLKIQTGRQEGDIAGTKMKKFARFLEKKLSAFFYILDARFLYSQGKDSELYLAAKSKGEIIARGPPVKMEEDAKAFREMHKEIFEKEGVLYAKEKIILSAKEFLDKFSKEEKRTMSDMGIIDIKLI